jgi:hypothetical protein
MDLYFEQSLPPMDSQKGAAVYLVKKLFPVLYSMNRIGE